jgi:hypothetical protein
MNTKKSSLEVQGQPSCLGAVSSSADYEGFHTHLKEYEENGIPTSFKDLVRLAKQYNCEIPKVVDGKLVFKTI